MTFAESLKQYMETIPCSASELSAVSGLAPSMISRYLRSEQTPGEKAITKLAAGLDFLSRDKGGPSLDHRKVQQALQESLSGISIHYDQFIRNLHRLLSGLSVNNNELARSLNFDPSYISRILAGTRKPANLFQFITNISDYLAKRFSDTPFLSVIADIVESDVKELPSAEILSYTIKRFLCSYTNPAAEIIPGFLLKLDTFEPKEEIRKKLSFPSLHLPLSKFCRGVKDMTQADLDFMLATAASSSTDDVILYNDMPLAEVTEDRNFTGRFNDSLKQLTDKGLTLHYIHDVHRPFGQLLSEMESFIPLYLSGRFLPYYLSEPTNHTFMHFLRSSGGACIYGEAVFDNPGSGRFSFSRKRDDVNYIHERAQELLTLSHPLMEVYTANRQDELNSAKRDLFLSAGSCRMFRTAPPLHTMSEKLLEKVIEHNGLAEKEASLLRSHYTRTRNYFKSMLSKNQLQIILPENGEKTPEWLSLPGLFFDRKLSYGEGEYERHLEDLRNYSIRHPSVSLSFGKQNIFNNLEVMFFNEKCVLISRCRDPEIHFIVYYPKLVRALESLAE